MMGLVNIIDFKINLKIENFNMSLKWLTNKNMGEE